MATFNPNVWYYISEKQEYWGPSKPWISEQSVIQITFNEFGRVQTIKYYDLKDAQNITMVARITPTSGKELTVLEQILGNVGKFSGPRQQGNPGAPTGGGALSRPSKKPKKKPRSCDRGFSVVRVAWRQCASTASSSRATMLVILIIGFTAGPAVSL